MAPLTQYHGLQFPPVHSESLLHRAIVQSVQGEVVNAVRSAQAFLRVHFTHLILVLVIVRTHIYGGCERHGAACGVQKVGPRVTSETQTLATTAQATHSQSPTLPTVACSSHFLSSQI
ncbi:hypothetical protein E2C01_081203 [Portunus trituberculatus]|uniref:Uncharacterized protein n=1 Tax=Portunus trituberculatus TaxID=210409 RepID=A0A5B7IY21_PORTR|nr:hypothetical protein [Portunus trituberculatus]